MLSESERTFLLAAARNSLSCAVRRVGHDPAVPATARLKEARGAFVSLHLGDSLRGCIGFIDPIRSLVQTVEEAARKAGTADRRFDRVTADELTKLRIEISVLSLPTKISGPEEIVIGTHGILIEARRRRGLLLPQVAPQHGWDAAALLNHAAEKAGLPEDAWKSPGVALYEFTAEIFHECTPHVEEA